MFSSASPNPSLQFFFFPFDFGKLAALWNIAHGRWICPVLQKGVQIAESAWKLFKYNCLWTKGELLSLRLWCFDSFLDSVNVECLKRWWHKRRFLRDLFFFFWNQREGCNTRMAIREITQIEEWGLWERYFWLGFELPCYRCRNKWSMLGKEVESQGDACKSVPGRMHGEVFQHGSSVDYMANSGFFWSRWRFEKL